MAGARVRGLCASNSTQVCLRPASGSSRLAAIASRPSDLAHRDTGQHRCSTAFGPELRGAAARLPLRRYLL